MADITLNWSPNPANELVSAYKVYQSTDGGVNFTEISEVTTPTVLIADLAPGQYHFRVSAVNLAGESGQSATVSGPGLPSAPSGVALSVS